MKKKIARRILNRNKWKLTVINMKDEEDRNNSERYLLKQSEIAKEVLKNG